MNIVYKVVFNRRKEMNQYPYYYIGSKCNCLYEDGKIYGKKNRLYYGSSTRKDYKSIVKEELSHITVELLGNFEKYQDCLEFERWVQIKNDVVASVEYFNKAYANGKPCAGYGSFRHTITGEYVRLPKDHELVLSGVYVGVTKGKTLSEDHKAKIGRSGSENKFFGKSHSLETKKILSEKQYRNRLWERRTEEHKCKLLEAQRRPKSKEHREKIGRKGYVVVRNTQTNEIQRMMKDDERLKTGLWVNPNKSVIPDKYECMHCKKLCSKPNLNRWHNDNCKGKKDDN